MLPEAVFAAVRARPGAVWLDGEGDPEGWSILAWDPLAHSTDASTWQQLGRAWSQVAPADSPAPFHGGVIGYLGFEASMAPHPHPQPEPPVWLGRYDGALCFHHGTQSWHATGTPAAKQRALTALAAAVPLSAPPPAPPSRATSIPAEAWQATVQHILSAIYEGDYYQVNLTRPIWAATDGDPWSLYRRLRAQGPAAYAAYLNLGEAGQVLCHSPELLLSAQQASLLSIPIKGTAPRQTNPDADRAAAAGLLASEKDLAELTMIVDLVRNDLGRIAAIGSVTASPRTVHAHAAVHHASVDVRATLQPGRDAWHALDALFPPGSVTGAPKLAAINEIRRLEHQGRGVYCGTIGYSSGDKAVWNVAIRTGLHTGNEVRFHVGGGIIADSTPEAEWQETKAKATAWATALGTNLP